jgi:hypothetical protein
MCGGCVSWLTPCEKKSRRHSPSWAKGRPVAKLHRAAHNAPPTRSENASDRVSAAYASHRCERLAMSVRFKRREDRCGVSSKGFSWIRRRVRDTRAPGRNHFQWAVTILG